MNWVPEQSSALIAAKAPHNFAPRIASAMVRVILFPFKCVLFVVACAFALLMAIIKFQLCGVAAAFIAAPISVGLLAAIGAASGWWHPGLVATNDPGAPPEAAILATMLPVWIVLTLYFFFSWKWSIVGGSSDTAARRRFEAEAFFRTRNRPGGPSL